VCDFFFEYALGRSKGVKQGQRRRHGYDGSVREASADTKECDVARCWLIDFLRACDEMGQVAFLIPMEEPILCIGARVKRRNEAEVAEDPDLEHRAVNAGAPDVGHMMIRSSEPISRCCDDCGALGGVIGRQGFRRSVHGEVFPQDAR